MKAPPPKAPPQPVPPTPQPPANVQKALARVTAAGPAMKSMLAAINKLGPGGNAAAFKLNGLVGKGPVASNAGMPGLGVGTGAGGGRELLNGKGGGGIGAMGAGGVGKGPVRAGVARAASDRPRARAPAGLVLRCEAVADTDDSPVTAASNATGAAPTNRPTHATTTMMVRRFNCRTSSSSSWVEMVSGGVSRSL